MGEGRALKAPFPYFGGKSKVATEVWQRFGDVANYVEPFCGSAAVLLGRPTPARIETVNDANCFIANFWRAIQVDPEAAAHYADWPVNEADLHARHRWLMLSDSSTEWRERMKTDPDFYDAKIAGWWVWGASCWIGAGWCDGSRLFARDGSASNKKPEICGNRGVAAALGREADRRRPAVDTAGNGIHRKRPAIANSGRADCAASLEKKRPRLTGWGGAGGHRQLREQIPDLSGDAGAASRGIHASGLSRKIPLLTGGHGNGAGLHRKIPELGSSRGDATATAICAWFEDLADRLRRVRVVCGDWKRVTTPAVTCGIGTTAIFFDPPYADTAGSPAGIYSEDDDQVAHAVRVWAIESGSNPSMRIALCGYEGEHQMPEDWECFAWQAQGGYANQKKSGSGFENRKRERIWFSPHCLTAAQGRLVA